MKKSIITLIKLLVAAACLAVIFHNIGTAEILEKAISINLLCVAAAIALSLGNRFLVAWRWHILLKARDIHASYMEIVRINFVSNFVGLLMPLSLGVDAIRLYQIQKTKRDISNTSGSLIADRLIAVLVLCVMSCIGVALSWNSFPDQTMLKSVFIVAVLCIVGIIAITADSLYHVVTAIMQRFFHDPTTAMGRASKKLTECHRAIAELTSQRKTFIPVAGVTILVQVCRMVIIHLLLVGVGVQPALTHEIAFVPIIILLGLLPITPLGLGIKEGAFVYFFSAVGHDASALVTASLYSHLTTLASVLPGACYFLAGKRDKDDDNPNDSGIMYEERPHRGGETQPVEVLKSWSMPNKPSSDKENPSQ